MLQSLFPEDIFRDEPVPLNQASLAHDLVLTDVMTALVARHPDCRITHGKLLPGGAGERRLVPDAVMDAPNGGGRVAIELELTPKSGKRYRAIVFQYRQDPRFQKVLYVVAGRSIEAKIRYHIAGRAMVPGLPMPATGKFEYMRLGELLQGTSTSGFFRHTPQQQETV
jgi:hypothetical protein